MPKEQGPMSALVLARLSLLIYTRPQLVVPLRAALHPPLTFPLQTGPHIRVLRFASLGADHAGETFIQSIPLFVDEIKEYELKRPPALGHFTCVRRIPVLKVSPSIERRC